MKKFRKVWTEEINAWLKTTKGMTPGEAYSLFLKTYPAIKDVTRIAFCNQQGGCIRLMNKFIKHKKCLRTFYDLRQSLRSYAAALC